MIRITVDKTRESNELISDVTFIQDFEDVNEAEHDLFNDIYNKCSNIQDLTKLIGFLHTISEEGLEDDSCEEFAKVFKPVLFSGNDELLGDIISYIYNRVALEINKQSRQIVDTCVNEDENIDEYDGFSYEGEMEQEEIDQIFGGTTVMVDGKFPEDPESVTEIASTDLELDDSECGGGGSSEEYDYEAIHNDNNGTSETK